MEFIRTAIQGSLLRRRSAGVLLHPTSLPGPGDAGVLGESARRFIGFLAEAGFAYWQMLPVGPVGQSLSPYQTTSAFAGNPRLIDTLELPVSIGPAAVDGQATDLDWPSRAAALRRAWKAFTTGAGADERNAFSAFWSDSRSWLLPYALFRSAREIWGEDGWWTWPDDLRRRAPAAVNRLLADHADRIREVAFEQWLFMRQWQRLREQALQADVKLIGDLPIYVDLDSADVWWHRHLFRVDADGRPEAIAGVPPDYFSADGQVWGNPLYDWERMQADGFRWWIDRVRHQLTRFDYLRIDHFRGLESFWEVPAGATTARDGHWREAPGAALLQTLERALGGAPFIAEDLGTITPAVHALRAQFGLPGMLVLQFAFDGSADNPYLPRNHVESAVIYPGTHDNDTLAGWYAGLPADTKRYVDETLGHDAGDPVSRLLGAVWDSPARAAIFPLQDLLGLGPEARLNIPGTVNERNWRWRFDWSQIRADLAATLNARADASGRGRADASGRGRHPGTADQPSVLR